MKRLVLAAALALTTLLPSAPAAAESIYRIEVGRDYNRYSNEELRRRVWDLERAVYQMQARVFQLEMQGPPPPTFPPPGYPPVAYPPIEVKQWTCVMQSFGKTFTSSSSSRAAASAFVLKKCGDATNAVHCHDSDVKCSND